MSDNLQLRGFCVGECLRIQTAAWLLAASDVLNFSNEPDAKELEQTRAMVRRALMVADLLLEEATP